MLRRRHFAQTQIVGETKRRQTPHEARRPSGYSPGSISGRAKSYRGGRGRLATVDAVFLCVKSSARKAKGTNVKNPTFPSEAGGTNTGHPRILWRYFLNVIILWWMLDQNDPEKLRLPAKHKNEKTSAIVICRRV